MIRAVIVEDEEKAADTLEGFIRRYAEESGESFDVTRFSDAVAFLEQYRPGYDIIFMDIELPHINGMDAVKRLREADADVTVIFVTNMAQFAVKGYEVHAFDFIVKPVSYYNLAMKITAALEALKARREVPVWISNRDGKRRLAASRIYYVEVLSHTLVYHTADGNFSASGTLASAEEQLKDARFSLCNRCYLVNLDHVTAIGKSTVTVAGEELQISRAKRAGFVRDLNDSLSGGRT